MIFEAASIYQYNDQGDVGLACHPVLLTPETAPTSIHEAESRPLLLRDVRLGEFALFASMADANGVAETAFLVTDRANYEDVTVAAYETIMQDPHHYVTDYLAKQLQAITRSELDQFNISELMTYIDQQFPQAT